MLTLLLILSLFPPLISSSFSHLLPLTTSKIPSNNKQIHFHHNITLTVSLLVGTPPQNVTLVIDTGSELSFLHCNTTTNQTRPYFSPTNSTSYSSIPCSHPICTTRTRDLTIPASCGPHNLCHAVLSYADLTSAEGPLGSDLFYVGSTATNTVFMCQTSGSSSDPDEDSKTTGLMGMNRGSLSFISQMGLRKFSYCISGSDYPGVLLLGDSNDTIPLVGPPLNYTPLVQMSTPLPYYNRVAYTVQLKGIKVGKTKLELPESILQPDHTGAGQTMVDSGTQFSVLLGPVYNVLRSEFYNQTVGKGMMRDLGEPDFVFGGVMDLCYRVNGSGYLPNLPSVTILFEGAEMQVSGSDRLVYRVPRERRGNDAVYCFTFGNSDLLGIEAYVIGHHHQQNVWMEFDLANSRMGLAPVQCDLAVQKLGLVV